VSARGEADATIADQDGVAVAADRLPPSSMEAVEFEQMGVTPASPFTSLTCTTSSRLTPRGSSAERSVPPRAAVRRAARSGHSVDAEHAWL